MIYIEEDENRMWAIFIHRWPGEKKTSHCLACGPDKLITIKNAMSAIQSDYLKLREIRDQLAVDSMGKAK